MKITNVILTPIRTGFFFDDQKAIKSGLTNDGFTYTGTPLTPGFQDIRVPGEGISLLLVLDNGMVACGDCCAVQYSGAGGRDFLFLADQYLPWMQEHIVPRLHGLDTSVFCTSIRSFESMEMHRSISYGLSQALLCAAAAANTQTITETVAQEYHLPMPEEPVHIFAQTGDERYTNADKMIIKGVDVLPHALINNIPDKLGNSGEKLLEYITWLKNRIITLRKSDDYAPELHIDVYGNLGTVFDNSIEKIADYLSQVQQTAAPFTIRIEGPADLGSRTAQVDFFSELTERIDTMGIGVEIVADEWCNTLEDIRLFATQRAGHMLQIKTPDLGGIQNTIDAVLLCKEKGIKAYQGGTCNETDRSARICTQTALATRPYQILAKPGMGFDEGYMIVHNEIQRTLALIKGRKTNG